MYEKKSEQEKKTNLLTSATIFSFASEVCDTMHVKQCCQINESQWSDSVQISLTKAVNMSDSKIITSCQYFLQIVCTIKSHKCHSPKWQEHLDPDPSNQTGSFKSHSIDLITQLFIIPHMWCYINTCMCLHIDKYYISTVHISTVHPHQKLLTSML